jgi:hypothetical protein
MQHISLCGPSSYTAEIVGSAPMGLTGHRERNKVLCGLGGLDCTSYSPREMGSDSLKCESTVLLLDAKISARASQMIAKTRPRLARTLVKVKVACALSNSESVSVVSP